MTTDPSTHLFWITSRAAGTTAMILASAAVGFGLVMSGRLAKGPNNGRRVIHEILSLSVMVSIAVHGLALLGDRYLHPSLLDVTVPFASGHRPLATSAGIVAGWALIALGLSYYARARIGIQRWQVLHRFTLLAWAGALVHTFAEGTDARSTWFVALIGVTALPALIALSLRVADGFGRRGARPARVPLARSGA